MSFATILLLYAIFIATVMNAYGALLASRHISNTVEPEALQIATTAAQSDHIKHVKQKIHENTVIGSTIQMIVEWIQANKLAPLQFDIEQDFDCHRALARNVIDQLLTSQRLSALFQDMNGETNVALANGVARLALVAMDLGESSALLAVVTEVLLICNDCSALNFIHFSVNQNTSIEKLPHIQQSMEFETLLIAANRYRDTENAFRDQHQHDRRTLGSESIERIAVSALEKINRLQAAAGFIVPTSMHDIASEKSGRRISNSSTLTNNSEISSSVCRSPSTSSVGTSNTSLTGYDLSRKERTEFIDRKDMLQPNEATYYDIIKFKTDLLHIKLEAKHLLDQVINPLTSIVSTAKPIHRIKQVQHAFATLISICCDTESVLNNLQYGFAFEQLTTHMASHLIDGAYSKLHQQTSIGDYQASDFKELTASVNKAFDVTSSALKAFSNLSAVPSSYYARYFASMEALMDRCTRLGSAYKSIDSVYQGVIEIRTTVQKGHDKLSTLQYDQAMPLKDIAMNITAIQSLFADIYSCSTQKLQALYGTLEQQINSSSTGGYQSEEKIAFNMVNRVFEDIASIKTKIKSASQELVHLSDKHDVKNNINQAKSWLQAMNYSLGLFITLEALFSFGSVDADQEALQDRYSDFQERFTEFTLTTYNKICSYFAEDYDAGLNYQKLGDTPGAHNSKKEEYKLFDSLQQVVDLTSKLLSYTHQALVQRKTVTEYLHHLNVIQECIASNTPLPASTSYEHAFACFSNISYPQLNIDGLSSMLYYYHRELYISLSETKVKLIVNHLGD
ncbi:Mitochondrial presequence protease [Mucor velutinosus]|uniref:Mitochondrial presequence protease n=1 Tax=Mucor velutinosus TaxID=708070 RepID=A0AAN7I325_9FUNG|nr:Mitochondrial presequence protease [Mucor velutinosus]